MTRAYYNENDPYAAEWLRRLILFGNIADGDVDERSIEDVLPSELKGYTQCHFFAGIGVWSHALRQAGWPDDRPAWTGSCPCQPFSAAGKGAGVADERHLWPAWFHLIDERRPPTIFGEQVASKDGLGWLDLVHADLEAASYSVGAFDLCAAGFGAPHIRQRLYFVADADDEGSQGRGKRGHGADQRATGPRGVVGGVADSNGRDACPEGLQRGRQHGQQSQDGGAGIGLGDAGSSGARRDAGAVSSAQTERYSQGQFDGFGGLGFEPSSPVNGAGPTNGFWRDADWLYCRDGKWRPVEPDTFPLAHGIAGRVGRLRAYGNAIVAPQATEFVRAYLER